MAETDTPATRSVTGEGDEVVDRRMTPRLGDYDLSQPYVECQRDKCWHDAQTHRPPGKRCRHRGCNCSAFVGTLPDPAPPQTRSESPAPPQPAARRKATGTYTISSAEYAAIAADAALLEVAARLLQRHYNAIPRSNARYEGAREVADWLRRYGERSGG